MKRRTVALWLGIVCTLLLVSISLAQGLLLPDIDWFCISGGGQQVQGGDLVLNSSIGQPASGVIQNANAELQGGYWYGTVPTITPGGPTLTPRPTITPTPTPVSVVRLPLVIKNVEVYMLED